jgi:pimeloyl-ACP methyl ester carboxylesterase
MAAALPNARKLRIPAAGHLTPLERPDEFNEALLGFLLEAAA